MRKLFLVLAVVAVISFTGAYAEQLAKGEKEINATFSYDSFDYGDEGDSVDTITLNGTMGYMLTDMHEVGGMLQYWDESNGFDESAWGLGAFYHCNFKAGDMMNPYIGARVAYVDFDYGEDFSPYQMMYGVVGGIKFYPWKNAGINVQLSYDIYSKDEAIDDGTDLQLAAGFLVKW